MNQLKKLLEENKNLFIDSDLKEKIINLFNEKNLEIGQLEDQVEELQFEEDFSLDVLGAISLLEEDGYTCVKFEKMVTQERLNQYIEFLKQNPL